MLNKGLYVPHISNKSHQIRVFRDVNSFLFFFILLALSRGTTTALTRTAIILSHAFLKPTNLLIMVVFLLPMCLNCKQNCIVTEINIQLNPLPQSFVMYSEMKHQPQTIWSHKGVRIPGHLIGSAHCHCPRTLSDRKQHE